MDLQQVWNQTYESRDADEQQREQLVRTEAEARLLAIDGAFDHWKDVVPFVRAAVKDLIQPTQEPPRPLTDYHVIAVGCPGNAIPASRRAEIFAYLQGGGHVLTTDLCLGCVVTAADWLGGERVTVGGKCGSHLVAYDLTAPGHPLLRGVAGGGSWQVQGGGDLIKVINTQDVDVLMTSSDLASTYGVGCDVIAFTTRVGRGRLVHFLSHAYAQTTDAQGAQAAATILVNLLDMAMIGADAKPDRLPEGSSVVAATAPSWFRLRAVATDELVTISSAGSEEERRLDRTRARALLTELSDSLGNNYRKYLNNDGTPILEFRLQDGSVWMMHVPEGANNQMLLNGAPLQDEQEVSDGDRLALFSTKLGAVVEGLDLVVAFPK